MSKAVKDYIKLTTLGLDPSIVTDEDKENLDKLTQRLSFLDRFLDWDHLIETYPLDTQANIFNELGKRQGKKCRLTFINAHGFPVEIKKAEKRGNRLLLSCVFCKTRKQFKMWLTTLLAEYDAKRITKFKPAKFASSYFSQIKDNIAFLKSEINIIQNKYNRLYEKELATATREYLTEVMKTPKIKAEAKSKRYALSEAEIGAYSRKNQGILKIKNFWNSSISSSEKEILLAWIKDNIYSIRVYGLSEGRSGHILADNFSDIEGIKYREINRDDTGKITSQDSITAHISFKTLDKAPMDILSKIVSNRKGPDIFYHNRLNDKNFALFLLTEYKDWGFKAGIRNLYKYLTVPKALQ